MQGGDCELSEIPYPFQFFFISREHRLFTLIGANFFVYPELTWPRACPDCVNKTDSAHTTLNSYNIGES